LRMILSEKNYFSRNTDVYINDVSMIASCQIIADK